MSEPAKERIELDRDPSGGWRWRYICDAEDGEPLELPANSVEPSLEEAVSAARSAYPGVPVHAPEEADEQESSPGRTRRWRTVVLTAVTGLLLVRHPAAGALALAAVAGLRLVRRRAGRGQLSRT